MSRIFYILPQSVTQIFSLAGHDFLLYLAVQHLILDLGLNVRAGVSRMSEII